MASTGVNIFIGVLIACCLCAIILGILFGTGEFLTKSKCSSSSNTCPSAVAPYGTFCDMVVANGQTFDMSSQPAKQANRAGCESQCSGVTGCAWYDYGTSDGTCTLRQPVGASGINVGLRMNDDTYVQYQNIDIPAGNSGTFAYATPTATTENACATACTNDTTRKCVWYRFDTTQNTCTLNQGTDTPGWIHGHRPQTTPPSS
jgi:hypothetical protein